VRDLLHKGTQWVRQKVTPILSIETLMRRNTGQSSSANEVKRLTEEQVEYQLFHRQGTRRRGGDPLGRRNGVALGPSSRPQLGQARAHPSRTRHR
jgi:hypothetical protein